MLSPGLYILIFTFDHNPAICASRAMAQQLSTIGTKNFWVVLDSGPLSVRALRFGSFLAVAAAAAAWGSVCLLSLFLSLAMVPRSCGIGLGLKDGIIGRKM